MGINVSAKTKLKATLKLHNSIASYMFEQECDELNYFSPQEKKELKNVLLTLKRVIANNG
jgi:hypothetical protein